MNLVVVVTSHNMGHAMRIPFDMLQNEILPAFAK